MKRESDMKSLKEVDWSKAPVGATHYNVACKWPWLKETPASYFCGRWIEYSVDSYEAAMKHFNNAVKRPQEWDGEGLPPVGTVCEYLKHAKYKTTWIKVRVVFIGGNLIVFEHGANSNEFSEQITEVSFRPIKTPEQIAAEERLHDIDEMMGVGNWHSRTFKDVISALYDAGYRKTDVKNKAVNIPDIDVH